MRPPKLLTKIFLDSGDPNETKEIISLLGFLDGQTTNPSLITKNPQVQERLRSGKKFSKEEVLTFYKKVVSEISSIIPDGSISIEVDAHAHSNAEELLKQGSVMFSWITNAHVKFPTTKAGLEAANKGVKLGMRVNMTLVFNQKQAGAVYGATKDTGERSLSGFKNVFLSPFIGRLDDIGINGMDLIKNCAKLYKDSDDHVAVLAASIRSYEHLLASFAYGADIVTAPIKVYKEWAEKGMPVPDSEFRYETENLKPIPFETLDLSRNWHDFDISDALTDKGLQKFSDDWSTLVE